MLTPTLLARIEQRNNLIGKRIACLLLCSFETITHSASKPEVVFIVSATLRLRDNVVDF